MAAAKKQENKPVAHKLPVNEARGEARLMIDDVELVLAAEMGRLAALSSRLQCKSLNDLFIRLSEAEVSATYAAIELLTVRGDALKALTVIQLRHFMACKATFLAILAHHFGDEDVEKGNGEAAEAA